MTTLQHLRESSTWMDRCKSLPKHCWLVECVLGYDPILLSFDTDTDCIGLTTGCPVAYLKPRMVQKVSLQTGEWHPCWYLICWSVFCHGPVPVLWEFFRVTKRQLADELHGQVEEVIGSTESGIIEKLLEVLLFGLKIIGLENISPASHHSERYLFLT